MFLSFQFASALFFPCLCYPLMRRCESGRRRVYPSSPLSSDCSRFRKLLSQPFVDERFVRYSFGLCDSFQLGNDLFVDCDEMLSHFTGGRLKLCFGVDQRIVHRLQQNGHDAIHLRDQGLQRLPDPDIFDIFSERPTTSVLQFAN
jgi:hypothetical protein